MPFRLLTRLRTPLAAIAAGGLLALALVESALLLRLLDGLDLPWYAAFLRIPVLHLVIAMLVVSIRLHLDRARPAGRTARLIHGAAAIGIGAVAIVAGWEMLPLSVALPLTGWLLVEAVSLAGRHPSPTGWRLPVLVGVGVMLACLAMGKANEMASRTNRLGLIAGVPSNRGVYSYEQENRHDKDDYPACTFETNALGYRSPEPEPKAGRRRILLIGDSFVWGDGIPTNGQTLGAQLQTALEARAPGRFDVQSAAYPGLGVYGYRRILETAGPALDADLAVIGWLGEADSDPLDAQAIVDRRFIWPPMRRLAAGTGIEQRIHAMSVGRGWYLWRTPAALRSTGEELERIGRFARAIGLEVVLLNYRLSDAIDGRFPPDGTRILQLPAGWRYPYRPNGLWYGRDFHPKPELNRLIAGWLADEIAAGRLTPGQVPVPENTE